MNVDDTPLNVYLRELRQEGGLEKLAEYVDKIADMKVLFVGDTIIDEYRYIKPLGKTPKDSIIACLDEDDETFAGGVIAAANHLAGFCDNVDILTTLGPADSYEARPGASGAEREPGCGLAPGRPDHPQDPLHRPLQHAEDVRGLHDG